MIDPASVALVEQILTIGVSAITTGLALQKQLNSGTPLTADDLASAKAITDQALAASDAADKLQGK